MGSLFSIEIYKLIEHYLAQDVFMRTKFKKEFDFRFYRNIIPYSVMAEELYRKFVTEPNNLSPIHGTEYWE
jgi:hypothetical protein